MMKPFAAVVLLVVVAAAACTSSTETSTVPDYAVTGVATAGPTCPVMQEPPDPGCADVPVAGAGLVILDEDRNQVVEVVTDAAGRFDLRLPAGDYVLEPQPVERLLGTAEPQPFATGPGLTADLLVQYDTGIR